MSEPARIIGRRRRAILRERAPGKMRGRLVEGYLQSGRRGAAHHWRGRERVDRGVSTKMGRHGGGTDNGAIGWRWRMYTRVERAPEASESAKTYAELCGKSV